MSIELSLGIDLTADEVEYTNFASGGWKALLAGAAALNVLGRAVGLVRLDEDLGALVERQVEVELVEIGQVRQHLEIELVAPIPAFDCARSQR